MGFIRARVLLLHLLVLFLAGCASHPISDSEYYEEFAKTGSATLFIGFDGMPNISTNELSVYLNGIKVAELEGTDRLEKYSHYYVEVKLTPGLHYLSVGEQYVDGTLMYVEEMDHTVLAKVEFQNESVFEGVFFDSFGFTSIIKGDRKKIIDGDDSNPVYNMWRDRRVYPNLITAPVNLSKTYSDALAKNKQYQNYKDSLSSKIKDKKKFIKQQNKEFYSKLMNIAGAALEATGRAAQQYSHQQSRSPSNTSSYSNDTLPLDVTKGPESTEFDSSHGEIEVHCGRQFYFDTPEEQAAFNERCNRNQQKAEYGPINIDLNSIGGGGADDPGSGAFQR